MGDGAVERAPVQRVPEERGEVAEVEPRGLPSQVLEPGEVAHVADESRDQRGDAGVGRAGAEACAEPRPRRGESVTQRGKDAELLGRVERTAQRALEPHDQRRGAEQEREVSVDPGGDRHHRGYGPEQEGEARETGDQDGPLHPCLEHRAPTAPPRGAERDGGDHHRDRGAAENPYGEVLPDRRSEVVPRDERWKPASAAKRADEERDARALGREEQQPPSREARGGRAGGKSRRLDRHGAVRGGALRHPRVSCHRKGCPTESSPSTCRPCS